MDRFFWNYFAAKNMLKQKKNMDGFYQLKFILKFTEVMNVRTDGKFSDYVV